VLKNDLRKRLPPKWQHGCVLGREYHLRDAGISWSAAEERSTWAISLGGQSRCLEADAAAKPAASEQPDQAPMVGDLMTG
jgi:hypothetical protein